MLHVRYQLRVPLGAAVLSVEQLADDGKIADSHELRDTARVLAEQRECVRSKLLLCFSNDTTACADERILCILNDVLALQKLEDGALQLDRTRFTLQSLLNDTSREFASAAAAKHLQLDTSLCSLVDPGLVTAEFDADQFRLQQVLSNLVSNGT